MNNINIRILSFNLFIINRLIELLNGKLIIIIIINKIFYNLIFEF